MAKRLLFITLISLILVAFVQLPAGFREERAGSEYPPDGDLLEVDGVKIHAQVFGEGPDLVLIHGASGNTRDFTFDLVARLQDRYRVIVMDRPGLGWSRQPEGYGGIWSSAGESPRLQARLLRQAADQLNVSNPLIVGHSFGGAVAMAWALDNPDTAGVVMLAGVSHPWPGDIDLLYRVNSNPVGGALLVPLITAFVPHGYINTVVASIFAPQDAPEGYLDHVGTNLTLRRSALRANARQINGLRPHVVEMHEGYPNLTMPIEVVHGDADTIVPLSVHSEPLSERVDSATLTVLEGAGHMPHHTHPDEVVAAIERAATRAGLR